MNVTVKRDYRMKLAELKTALAEEYGYSEDFFDTLGKTFPKLVRGKLINLLKAEDEAMEQLDFGDGSDTGDFEIAEDEGVKSETEEDPPTSVDAEWTDYVLGHLRKDELINKNPKVDGLRRLAEIFIGEITAIVPTVHQTPDPTNERRGTVSVTIAFETEDGNSRVFGGAADVYSGNTDTPYGSHPVATAETRAEGRALKRALRLQKVVSAEEVAATVTHHETGKVSSTQIDDQQIKLLSVMCAKSDRGMDINVEKFVAHQTGKTYNTVRELSLEQGKALAKTLSEYQQDVSSIPDDITGYDTNWLDSFGK